MNEDPNWFWKNFRLGAELRISGSFIYNALFHLDQMETFYYEEECFEFLYCTSIGIERLLKIAVILTEHSSIDNQEDFERTLITHNSSELIKRLQESHQINIGIPHNKFLSLIDKFYKSTRYSRFNLESVYKKPQDQYGLISFVSEYLNIDFSTSIMNPTRITPNIRRFLGKIIGKLTTQIYAILKKEAYRNKTFTYEIPSSSKAFKIFIAKEFHFENERITQREALLHIMRTPFSGSLQSLIDKIPTINLGEFNNNKYIKTLFKYEKDRQVMEEIEYVYEEDKTEISKRLEDLALLGADINFDYLDELSKEE